MPIDLSLARVSRLLAGIKSPHCAYKSIHVAGTNGKGSILAYLSSILTTANIPNGRFTSPHMLYPNDSVCINNSVYPKEKFARISQYVKECDARMRAGCTEFELLTVTAFLIFKIEKVKVALVEVGLGGRLDATNVLEPVGSNTQLVAQSDAAAVAAIRGIPGFLDLDLDATGVNDGGVIATAISKIGLDHESILGKTLGEIAYQKAGIIKQKVPCVADATNNDEALQVISDVATQENAPLYKVSGDTFPDQRKLSMTPLCGQYQKHNLSVALTVLDMIQQKYPQEFQVSERHIVEGIAHTEWQGRLQELRLEGLDESVIIDGAHNESAAIELGKYLQQIRNGQGILFVVGMTRGKDAEKLLRHIAVRSTDTLVATTFTKPQDMPWIEAMDTKALREGAASFIDDIDETDVPGGIGAVLAHVAARKKAANDTRQIVVCGSLYLCGDVLRSASSGRKKIL